MIEIKDLAHSFGEKILYKDVNININKGEKIGLIGLNGTGKSTLINILNGSIISEKGQVVIPKNITVGYLDQFISVDNKLTIQQYLESAFEKLYKIEKEYNETADKLSTNPQNEQELLTKLNNLFERLLKNDFYDIPTKINQVANGLGISNFGMNKLLSQLSGGQKMKVMLAKILLQNPDFLILDEPTNYLDVNHIEWFVAYLNKFEGNVLLVSHDVEFLDRIVNVIWALEKQTIIRYNGNYSAYIKQKELSKEVEEKRIQNIEREANKLREYIAKNKVRTATAKQAKSREKRLEKLEVIEQEKELPEPNFSFKYIDNHFNNVLIIKNLSIGYDKVLLNNITISIQKGEKIRLTGFNGLGKSTLLKTICNIIPALAGTINWGGKNKIGYFEQDMHFDDDSITPLQEILNIYPQLKEKEARSLLARVGITAKHIMESLKHLSGGEQCRVQLAKLMLDSYSVLILDEPTNHLDIKAKKVLARAINNYAGTVLFVSHEQEFANMINDYKEIDMKRYKVR